MHGYAVVQAITMATDGKLTFGEGSIYPVLHRLENEGKLSTKRIEVKGRERVIYSTTKNGLGQLAESRAAWQKVTDAIHTAFEGGEHVQPAA